MDTDRLTMRDFEDTPSACKCTDPCDCRAPNPFVAALTGRQSR